MKNFANVPVTFVSVHPWLKLFFFVESSLTFSGREFIFFNFHFQNDFDEIDMSGEAGCFFRDQKRRIGEYNLHFNVLRGK